MQRLLKRHAQWNLFSLFFISDPKADGTAFRRRRRHQFLESMKAPRGLEISLYSPVAIAVLPGKKLGYIPKGHSPLASLSSSPAPALSLKQLPTRTDAVFFRILSPVSRRSYVTEPGSPSDLRGADRLCTENLRSGASASDPPFFSLKSRSWTRSA